MQSTGKEKFTVYVYYKTRVYSPENDKAGMWDSSSEGEDNNEESKEGDASDAESGSESKDEDEITDDK